MVLKSGDGSSPRLELVFIHKWLILLKVIAILDPRGGNYILRVKTAVTKLRAQKRLLWTGAN
jgi:hypothetical protein